MSEPLRFLGIAEWFSDVLGVSALIGEIISMAIILLIFLVPMFLMKTKVYIFLVIGILFLTIFTAIGWLSFYTWVIIAVILGLMISERVRNLFG